MISTAFKSSTETNSESKITIGSGSDSGSYSFSKISSFCSKDKSFSTCSLFKGLNEFTFLGLDCFSGAFRAIFIDF